MSKYYTRCRAGLPAKIEAQLHFPFRLPSESSRCQAGAELRQEQRLIWYYFPLVVAPNVWLAAVPPCVGFAGWLLGGMDSKPLMAVVYYEASEDVAGSWNYDGVVNRGGQFEYSNPCIRVLLTLKVTIRLAFRQLEGFAGSIFQLMGIDLKVPCYTQVCRRQKGPTTPRNAGKY